MKTKYELIIDYLKSEIKSGTFKSKLPSIRALAIKFSCSNSTVIRAYSELEKNGLIYAMPKSGYFISEKKLLTPYEDKDDTINFSTGEPSSSIFPGEEFKNALNLATDHYGNDLFSYGSSNGFKPLRESLAERFKNEDIHICEGNLIFTNGVQEAMSILSKMDFPNSKKNLLVENPTYNLFIGWLKLNNLDFKYINRDFNGIDLNKLESIFKKNDIKIFYTIPRLHNPLGTSYTEEQKKSIIYLANKYNVYIAEDDYLYGLWDENDKSLKSYDTEDMVIHMKSFSKTLLPSIRLGAIAVPDALKETFIQNKIYLNFRSSQVFQCALNEFLKCGKYDTYMYQIKKHYDHKLEILKDSFKESPFNYMSCNIPEHGFFSYFNLPNSVPFSDLSKALSLRNIEIRNGCYFFAENTGSINAFRLSTSKVDSRNIKYAAETIIGEFNNLFYLDEKNINNMIEL